MKKLLFFILALLAFLVIGVQVITSAINETITKEDLPQAVYQDNTPFDQAHSALQDFFDVNSEEDNYSKIETFMNYMIYDSIKENLNEDYNPLGECETDACSFIIVTDHATIDYAFATLNDDDQIVLTISVKRLSYPTVETAVHLVFDVTINELDASFTLTLNHAKIADKVISMTILDTIMSYVDKQAIEDSITYGELDLDEYTLTVSLLDIN
jgi:hypothetical protein